MNLYFAPLEGITGYVYRNTHAEMFGMCDAYYAPFITPVENEKLNKKCLRDILPENNRCPSLRVQLLSNNSKTYFKFEEEIIAMGYTDININIGCPPGTVVKKGRGAGFLRDTSLMDLFFEEIFCKNRVNISVKTRIGFYDGNEWDSIMNVYNKFPLESLIVHPRTREDYYKGSVRMDIFSSIYHNCVNTLCYNGDIRTCTDYRSISEAFPKLEGIMIGRGAVANPAIFREIKGGEALSTEELLEFSALLFERYYEVLKSDMYTLHKLKEIWIYMMMNYPEEKKILKAVKKANTVSDLHIAVKNLPKLQ